jgi:hypothetical protein
MKQINKETMERILKRPFETGEPVVFFGEEAQFLSRPVTGYELLACIQPLYQEIYRTKERIREMEAELIKTKEVLSKRHIVGVQNLMFSRDVIDEIWDKEDDTI